MANIMLFGEPMALLTADSVGPLEQVEHFTRSLSGAEVNVAIGLTRLGHNVEYLTRLGDDPFGHYIENELNNKNIGTNHITYDSVFRTGIQLKNRVVDGSDPYAPYYRKCSAASHISTNEINKLDLDGINLIHVTGIPAAISLSAREATFRFIKRAKDKGIFITFDPNLRSSLWENNEVMIETINEISNNVDLIMPGIEEGEILVGTRNIEQIEAFYRNKGVKIIIIKEGSKGAFYNDGNLSEKIEGFTVDKAIDTVGAGDGFAVGIISGILEGLSMHDCVIRANAIGAIQVGNISDNEGLPNRAELEKFLSENNN